MDLKSLIRTAVIIIILFSMLGVVYYGYLEYKWELTGYVKDSSGKPVSGLEVILFNEKNKLISKTDENGFYRFSSNILKKIPTGMYGINATQPLPTGAVYTGYSGGVIQITGKDLERNISWIKSDEAKSAEDQSLIKYEGGLNFVTYQVRPNESADTGSGGGMFWVRVDLTGLGDEYGIQIENAPGDNVSSSLIKGDIAIKQGRDIMNSTVVDVDSRAKGKYPQFLNAFVFAGLESAKLREGVYRLTAKQEAVIFATITTGELTKNVFDKDGNFVSASKYMDMCVMSQGYFDRYFEIVDSTITTSEERIEFRCKDNEEAWKKYTYACTMTQHCSNQIAVKYNYTCVLK